MSAFENFMDKEYPYYKSADIKYIDLWREVWNAAVGYAETLKPSHNRQITQCPHHKIKICCEGDLDVCDHPDVSSW